MKKYILLLVLINAVDVYAMEQESEFDRNDVAKVITSFKEMKMSFEEFSKSCHIFATYKAWWKKYTRATVPEKNIKCLHALNNSLTPVADSKQKQMLLDANDILELKEKDENNNNNNEVTSSEILSQEKITENINDALTNWKESFYGVPATDYQIIEQKKQQNTAKLMFQYLKRKKEKKVMINTVEGEEVPIEIVAWADNVYIPFCVWLYLNEINAFEQYLGTKVVENREQNLIDTIMQLQIAENRKVGDNEQNLVDAMKQLKKMMQGTSFQ